MSPRLKELNDHPYILSKKQSITEFLCKDSLTIDDFVIKYTYRYDDESGNYVKEPLEHNLRKPSKINRGH